jgi:tetrahydromethanopterin S-methyltransferase subunit A
MPSRMEDFGFLLTRLFASTKKKNREWPFVLGKYFVVDPSAPVAVTTLGSVDLAGQVSKSPPKGLCIVGKVETENIGIEKIIKNVISNPAIRYLVCAGNEPPKHLTGATMIALFQNGVDEKKKIIGSPSMRPILPNTSPEEIQAFRDQVEPVDMIGCTDIAEIHKKVSELAAQLPTKSATEFIRPADLAADKAVEHVVAQGTDPMRIKLDKAGYFVINIENDALLVEHYNYQEELLRVIEGEDARSIYLTIVRNGWISRLDHAAYLGRQLARAEYSITNKSDYKQDGG